MLKSHCSLCYYGTFSQQNPALYNFVCKTNKLAFAVGIYICFSRCPRRLVQRADLRQYIQCHTRRYVFISVGWWRFRFSALASHRLMTNPHDPLPPHTGVRGWSALPPLCCWLASSSANLLFHASVPRCVCPSTRSIFVHSPLHLNPYVHACSSPSIFFPSVIPVVVLQLFFPLSVSHSIPPVCPSSHSSFYMSVMSINSFRLFL